ncbi:MAG: sigma-70 family RNA polymerase sigma factor [Planctomycetes bacterium]|nr:sigma-70 family RNA polymerase sigma factor [Planctomycetota bacterium]
MSELGQSPDVTRLLVEWRSGREEALAELVPIVHQELKRIAERHMYGERVAHTLQATALVNEAFIKLTDNRRVRWRDRTHFFSMASKLMRRILVDHARKHGAEKRGGQSRRIQLDPSLEARSGTDSLLDLLDLEEALNELARHDAAKAEIIELRYFGGLTLEEIASVRGMKPKKVWSECQFAQAWLLRRVAGVG